MGWLKIAWGVCIIFVGTGLHRVAVASSCDPQSLASASLSKSHADKKKILIFTSKGGNGSWSASDSLAQFLSPEYQVMIVNPFEQVFGSLDYVKKLTRGKSDGEDAYNHLLNTKLIGLVNFLCRYIAPYIISWNFKKMEERFRWFLYQEQPDLVISVAPWINQPIARAAATCKIPFILSTLDTDLFMWLFGMEHHDCAQTLVTVHEHLAYLDKTLRRAGFKEDSIKTIGVPLRKPFFEPKNPVLIRQHFSIPLEKFSVMLLMGGTGAKSMESYVKKILSLGMDIHLLICVGRDKVLKKRIEQLIGCLMRKPTTCTVIGFTDQIADLMAVSNLLITKTGSLSVNEAVHMKLPMLLDCTSKVLFWEQPNIGFVKERGFGEAITSLNHLETMLASYLPDNKIYQNAKDKLSCYQRPFFHEAFKQIVVDQLDQKLYRLVRS